LGREARHEELGEKAHDERLFEHVASLGRVMVSTDYLGTPSERRVRGRAFNLRGA
jgi:hypothetical protein